MLISWLAHFSTLKMEMTCSPKISVDFQWTSRHYILEDRILHNHHSENLILHEELKVF
jgi:hypothetical protein